MRILQEAGFKVVTGPSYDGLFKMLMMNRFELFSRSVVEVLSEYEELKNSDIVIDKNIVLYYPLPRYFFTAKTEFGNLLAKRVEVGLMQMHKDGTFQKMFDIYRKPIEKELNLKNRKFFKISNPFLHPMTPLENKILWQ